MMYRVRFIKEVLVCSLVGVLASGCLFSGIDQNRDGAVEISAIGAGSDCGKNAFASLVHLSLRANCVSCHSGAGPGPGKFAHNDYKQAYDSAVTRANFFDAGASLLVQMASDENHGTNQGCAACGSAFGSELTLRIESWANAELGFVDCSQYQGPGTGDDGFDISQFLNPPTSSVTVNPQGLIAFGAAHTILQTSCSECHVVGGPGSHARFGSSDPEEAYIAAIFRTFFPAPASSMIIQRASNLAHGSNGCDDCGDPVLVNNLTAALTTWAAAEGASAANNRVSTTPINMGGFAGSPSGLIAFNLGSSFGNAQLVFERYCYPVNDSGCVMPQIAFRLANPKLVTPPGVSINIADIRFVIDGTLSNLFMTYSNVNETVPPNQQYLLSPASVLVPVTINTLSASMGGLSQN